MMTSSIGNIFCITDPLLGVSTGDRWIPLKKASDAELWCFLSSALEQAVNQTTETPVIWDAIALIMTSHCLVFVNHNCIDSFWLLFQIYFPKLSALINTFWATLYADIEVFWRCIIDLFVYLVKMICLVALFRLFCWYRLRYQFYT